MQELQTIIEAAYNERSKFSPKNTPPDVKNAIANAIGLLDTGQVRIAQKLNGQWQVNEWLKKAVLLYFCTHDNEIMANSLNWHFDKVPIKFQKKTHEEFVAAGVRIVPPATARKGAFIAPNTILMPSYVNIGAYIDSGTLIDTWATVGSCAQIGKNVHISGGVGIGGVLEPVQCKPDYYRR